MSTPVVGLAPRSFACDGLATGPGTPFVVTKFEPGGKPESTLGDKDRHRGDGTFFGEDQLKGRLLKFELTIDTASYTEAQDAWRHLSRVWDAEAVRTRPGAVLALRVRQFAGPTRVVFGRPNAIDPANEDLMESGRLDVVCDFRCIDHLFYSDEEHSTTVGLVRPFTNGLRAPLTAPLISTASSEGAEDVVVGGDVPAWVALTYHGPIVNPAVQVTGQWTSRLSRQLYDGQTVTVDPRPESRGVRAGPANASGDLTADSPYLSEMRVPPGGHEVVLRGTDETGTASVTVTHRDAFLTL